MKKYTYLLILLVLAGSCKDKAIQPSLDCSGYGNYSSHPKAGAFAAVLDKYSKKGIPGISLLVKDASGTWAGASGMADIKENISMQPCHVAKVASITKIFMATLTFKLAEEGVLNIDEKISSYLPSDIISKVKNAEQVTLRQLLSHNSGIYDVISDNGFYLGVLNNPDKNWTSKELLNYVENKEAAFAPGEGPGYSNTNTLLVALIIDHVTKRPHAQLLKEKIINPLGLKDTYYYYHDALPEGRIAQGYYDLYNNGSIVNLSNYNTGSGNGYTGLYTTVFDMYTFIDALLVQESILSPNSLNQMKDFNPKEETEKLLGAGLFKDFIHHPSNEFAIGHRGRDLAYSADLFYFPNKNQVMSLIVNYGTDADSRLRPAFYELRDEIVTTMMQ